MNNRYCCPKNDSREVVPTRRYISSEELTNIHGIQHEQLLNAPQLNLLFAEQNNNNNQLLAPESPNAFFKPPRRKSAAPKRRRPSKVGSSEVGLSAPLPYNRLLPLAIVRQPQTFSLDSLLGSPPGSRGPPASQETTTAEVPTLQSTTGTF